MIRNYDELVEYMTVQGLIVREPRPEDGRLAMNCTPEGAQVCYLILGLIGGEEQKIAERAMERAEQAFRRDLGLDDDDDAVAFTPVAPVQDLIQTMIVVLSQHPRFGDALTAALKRRG